MNISQRSAPIWLEALAVLIFGLAGVAFAAEGFNLNPSVNVLDGASIQLETVDVRLESILWNETNDDPRELDGTRGALHAISLNLRSINNMVERGLNALPEDLEVLPQRVEEAVARVNQAAVHVADRARIGFEQPPDDLGVYLALEEVQSAAEGIASGARNFVAGFWDRVIPVRFVQVLNCYPWVPGCDPHLDFDSILASVVGMNEAFGPADLHFMVKSVEEYYMYHFAHEAFLTESWVDWMDAANEIGQVFPIDTSSPVAEKHANEWVTYMSTVFSDPTELLIWVFGYDSIVSRQNSHHSISTFPNGGRTVVISAQNIFDPLRPQQNPPQPGLSPYHLTHEVGHFFGIRHTWDAPSGTNPYSGSPVDWPDLWDIVYCEGELGLPLYFNNWDEADSADCTFHMIENWDPANCIIDNRYGVDDSDMECVVQGNFFASGDLLMKGLSFDLGTPENHPDSFAWGLNVMSYYSRYNAHLWTPGRFSAAQLSLIWGHAHGSVPIPDTDDFYWPHENLFSQRVLLGTGPGE